MNITMCLMINLYALIMLMIIYNHSNKHYDKDFLNNILFRYMMIVTGLMLIVDVFSRFDGGNLPIYIYINHIGNFLIFLLSPILPSLWMAYVFSQIYENHEKIRMLGVPLGIFNLVNLSLLIASQYNGWYYYIDKNNIYHRGPFYFVTLLMTTILLIISSILIFTHRDKIKSKRYYSLTFFIFPPLVGMVLQVIFYGTSLMLPGMVISILVLFLNIQNKDLSQDYLTQVYNRKKIDSYLKMKIKKSGNGMGFSAMILDINNFKQINDRYGHDEGDRALQTVARLLREFVGPMDFVGRFGGDEFYIILEESDQNHLQNMVLKIKTGMQVYNQNSAEKYCLEFSMGYAVYSNEEQENIESFQKKIDTLMYEDKEQYRQLAMK